MKQKWVIIVVAFLIIIAAAAALVYLVSKSHPNTPPPNWKTYANTDLNYTVIYPATFSADDSHVYTELGPGKEIRGVSFTVPESLTHGTNLSKDTYFAVEYMNATSTNCSALNFLDTAGSESKVSDNGITYNYAHGADAAAGNIYEEYVYAIDGSSPCVALRYFIHSGNIANYPPGDVIEFDKNSLLSVFDTMRQSLKLSPR